MILDAACRRAARAAWQAGDHLLLIVPAYTPHDTARACIVYYSNA